MPEAKTNGETVRVSAVVLCDIPDHTRDSRCRSHRFCVVTGFLRRRALCSVPMPTRPTSRHVVGRAGVHYSICKEEQRQQGVRVYLFFTKSLFGVYKQDINMNLTYAHKIEHTESFFSAF